MTKILLAGYGEVGKGLYKVLSKKHKIEIVDPVNVPHIKLSDKYDLLFIAFPYSNYFIASVKQYQKIVKPLETIIFSTVPIGTCKEVNAVHSPIEGKHPNLEKSIKVHKRWFGGIDCLRTLKIFRDLKISCRVLKTPEHTEFLKLRSTSLYGVNIEFARYSKKVADKIKMPFDFIKQFDEDYNKLYKKMKLPQFQRYILNPPEGITGGHCIVPNAKLLDRQFPNIFLKEIYKKGKCSSCGVITHSKHRKSCRLLYKYKK